MNHKERYKKSGWSFDLVPPAEKYCRYFVRKGAVTKYNYGFRSRKEVDAWIEGFGELIEEQDAKMLRIKLKGNNGDVCIVNRDGEVCQRSRQRKS